MIDMIGYGLYAVFFYLVALLIIVFVHEFGHYIVARWCGIRAEVFSLGMGKPLAGFTDRRGTRWQIAALPIGGYVKFIGDGDAASATTGDLSILSAEQRRASLSGAPLYARALTVAAGPAFNFIFAILVFAAFMMVQGVAKEPFVVAKTPSMMPTELLPGDEVRTIAGMELPDTAGWDAFLAALPEDQAQVTYGIIRDGTPMEVTGQHPFPVLVSYTTPGAPARNAGLREGDWIIEVDGTKIATFAQFRKLVGGSGGKTLNVTFLREGEAQPISVKVTPVESDVPRDDASFETRWSVGVSSDWSFTHELTTPPIGRALSFGTDRVWWASKVTVSALIAVVKGKINSCAVNGPLRIADAVGKAASEGAPDFIWTVAFLSAVIGLMNLFPIPILDGGHLLLYAVEAVTRRRPGIQVQTVLNSIGLTLIMALLLFGLFNDFRC